MTILTIARLTLFEASRRRLLLAIALLTVLVVGLTSWGFQHLVSALNCGSSCEAAQTLAITATLLILIIFMFSFVFSVASVFLAAPAIAADVESGILLAVLPRPIRRADVIIGRWLGLTVLAGGYAVVTAGLEFLSVRLLTGYMPPHPFAALAYLAGESSALLLLGLLFSTRLAPMTGGIIVLVLFGAAWIGGIAEGIGVAVGSTSITTVGVTSSLLLPTDGLWRGALYGLEPALMIAVAGGGRAAAANPFLVSAPPSAAYLAWAIAWMAGMLALSILSFARREL